MVVGKDADYPLKHITIAQNLNKDNTNFWLPKLVNIIKMST